MPSFSRVRRRRLRPSRHVLAFVSGIRAEHGLPPALRIEPGLRGAKDDCALARTIGGGAVVGRWHTAAFGRRYRNPPRVVVWIWRFDRNAFAHLTTLRPTRRGIGHLDFALHAAAVDAPPRRPLPAA